MFGQVLMTELVKLRQQQQSTKSYLETMEQRLKKTETKQQLMMNFLAKAIQNPDFLQQLIHQKHKHRELEEAINRKRRRHVDQAHHPAPPSPPDHHHHHHQFKPFVNDTHMDVDLLAVEIENHHVIIKEEMVEIDERLLVERDRLDEGFWESLLNEANEDGFGVCGFEEQEDNDEDGDELIHQFGFSSSGLK